MSKGRQQACFLNATYSAHGHLVGGQGARLIRADNRSTAQGFDRRQAANNGVFLGHATRAEGQAGSDDSGQALGDGSHRQGHGDLKVVDGPSDPGAAVDGVSEVADVDDPHGDTDQGDDLGELLPELIQLLLQRGLLLLRRRHLITDFTDLCAHTCSHDDTDGPACSDVGALRKKKQIEPDKQMSQSQNQSYCQKRKRVSIDLSNES